MLFELRGMWFELRGMWFELRGMWFELRGMWFVNIVHAAIAYDMTNALTSSASCDFSMT